MVQQLRIYRKNIAHQKLPFSWKPVYGLKKRNNENIFFSIISSIMILTLYSNFLISVTDISVTGMHLATTTFIECNSNSIWLTFCFNKDATSIGTTVEYRHDNIIIDTNPSPSETILFWSWTNNVNMVSWTVAVCKQMESVHWAL